MKDETRWQDDPRYPCKECRGRLEYRLKGDQYRIRCKACRREWRADLIEF